MSFFPEELESRTDAVAVPVISGQCLHDGWVLELQGSIGGNQNNAS